MKKIITCSSTTTFEAAHRIFGHDGHCECLHGHRYVCTFIFTARKLNKLGMIIDFSDIRKILHTWIKENLDHNVVLFEKDTALINAIEKCTKQRIYKLKLNPTVENLASHLLENVCPKLFKKYNVRCVSVEIEETASNKGKASVI